MQKWEYKTLRDTEPDRLIERMNDLGKMGWELVGSVYTESYFSYVCFLKRPILAIEALD